MGFFDSFTYICSAEFERDLIGRRGHRVEFFQSCASLTNSLCTFLKTIFYRVCKRLVKLFHIKMK